MPAGILPEPSFAPDRWLRGSHVQSILTGLAPRRMGIERRARALISASQPLLLDCGEGVRLLALHASRRPDAPAARGVVVLLHGWEGSADSAYVLSLGQVLFDQDYAVVRLNLRDHGGTQHLNRELFHSCRLPEVQGAVQRLRIKFAEGPMFLAGFSLGGNFMLRVAAAAAADDLELAHVFAVSPVLDPASTLDALENGWSLYHRYFVSKWARSLRLKQSAWPEDYELAPLLRSRNLRRMTAALVERYTEYPDLGSYLSGYALTGSRLDALRVPSTIITALDDPIIPAADLARLSQNPALRIIATENGGHCGFVEAFGRPSWVDRFILREIERVVRRD